MIMWMSILLVFATLHACNSSVLLYLVLQHCTQQLSSTISGTATLHATAQFYYIWYCNTACNSSVLLYLVLQHCMQQLSSTISGTATLHATAQFYYIWYCNTACNSSVLLYLVLQHCTHATAQFYYIWYCNTARMQQLSSTISGTATLHATAQFYYIWYCNTACNSSVLLYLVRRACCMQSWGESLCSCATVTARQDSTQETTDPIQPCLGPSRTVLTPLTAL